MPTSLRFHSSLVLQLAPELGSELLSALRGISSLLSCLHHYSVLFCPYHLGAVLNAAHTLDCHFGGLAHGTGIGDLVRHPAIQQLSKSSTKERHEMSYRKWQNEVMAEGGGILERSKTQVVRLLMHLNTGILHSCLYRLCCVFIILNRCIILYKTQCQQ